MLVGRYRVVWGELLLLVALFVFGVLHAFNIAEIETPYRILLLFALLYLFHLISFVRIMTGERSIFHDILIGVSFILLAGTGAFPLLPLAASTTIVLGGVLLAVTSSRLAVLPVRSPSILSAFTDSSKLRRVFFVCFFAFGFFVAVFMPLVYALLSLSNIVFLRPLISAIVFIVVLHEQKFFSSPILRRVETWLSSAARQLQQLFFQRRTLLLGIAGILVAHFTVQVGYSLDALWYSMRDAQGMLDLLMTILSGCGTVILFALPMYIWLKVFHVRQSHEHLPDWSTPAVSAVLALVVAALVYQVVTILPISSGPGALLYSSLSTNNPLIGLTLTFTVLLGSMMGSMLDDHVRRMLMAGPFLAAVIFFGIFVYQSFVSSFIQNASLVLTFSSGILIAAIPIVSLLFFSQTMFLITGFLSFLYEIWRD